MKTAGRRCCCRRAACGAGDRLHADLSRAQARGGAGAWPLARAVHWLERDRLRSAAELVGLPVKAQDGVAGFLADLLVDIEECCVDYVLLDAEGGSQLVPLDWMRDLQARRALPRVQRTRAELRELPLSE